MPTRLTVTERSNLTDHLVRVRFEGVLDEHYAASEDTDRYVKLIFTAPDVELTEDTDVRELMATLPEEKTPIFRTYTLRDLDAAAGTVAIDFVVHGEEGIAGPWAAKAQPGDVMWVNGPGGAYAPDPAADAHLIVGDESALPAVAAAVEELAPEAKGYVFVEVAGPGDETELPVPAGVELRWLHRGAASHETDLIDGDSPMVKAVRELDASGWPEGRVQVFVHGEGNAVMHEIRPLLKKNGVARGDLSVSAYWRRGRTEEGFRVWKQELAKAESD